MIIFNEKEHAEKIIKDGFLISNQEIRDLFIYAKYLYYIGKDSEEVNNKLKEFLVSNRKEYSENVRNGIARKTTISAKSGILVFDKKIQIHENEIKIIRSLDNIDLQKLMFSYIVLSKFFNGLFKISRDELFRLAKINTHDRNKPTLIHELNKTKNTTSIVKKGKTLRGVTIEPEGEVLLEFIVDDNFILEYLHYIGDKSIIRCYICNKFIVKTTNNKKYCKECSREIKMELDRVRMKEKREKSKATTPPKVSDINVL